MTPTDRKRLLELHAATSIENDNCESEEAFNEFAEAAHELVPALVQELERLEREREQQRQWLSSDGFERLLAFERLTAERDDLRAENERLRRKMKLLATELLHPPTVDHVELERLRNDVRRLREERDVEEMCRESWPSEPVEVDLIDPSEVPCCKEKNCSFTDAWLKKNGA